MKKIFLVFLVLGLFFLGCDLADPEIRVKNSSPFEFYAVKIGDVTFSSVASGSVSDYKVIGAGSAGLSLGDAEGNFEEYFTGLEFEEEEKYTVQIIGESLENLEILQITD